MRATIRGLLLDHPAFVADVPTIYGASAVPLNPPKPFAVIRMGGILRGQGDAKARAMSLWVHDVPGTYELIDAALASAREALDVWNIKTARGWLMRSEWLSDGVDMYDDGYQTIVREGRWELIGTGE